MFFKADDSLEIIPKIPVISSYKFFLAFKEHRALASSLSPQKSKHRGEINKILTELQLSYLKCMPCLSYNFTI